VALEAVDPELDRVVLTVAGLVELRRTTAASAQFLGVADLIGLGHVSKVDQGGGWSAVVRS
jgi:hypothetical protein